MTINSHFFWVLLANVATVIALFTFLDAKAKRWTTENIVKQITQNGGKNDPPTLPDRLHKQDQALERIEEKQDRIEEKVDAQGRDLSSHLAWSSDETSRLWKAIADLKEKDHEADPTT